MKRHYQALSFTVLFFSLVFTGKGQYIWSKRDSIPQLKRVLPATFTIGTKAFMGGSRSSSGTLEKDFWCYNPSKDTWTKKGDMPGNGRYAPAHFSIGSKGYMGLGYDGSVLNDFWQYDTLTDKWTQKASYPGAPRYEPTSFVINGKAYVGMGSAGGPPYLQDFYCYDPALDKWTAIASFPGTGRNSTFSFVINGKAYVGMGWDGTTHGNDWWVYDPATNKWTQKANFPSTGRDGGASFVLDTTGYIVGGKTATALSVNEFWKYSAATDTWTALTPFPGDKRYWATGFVVNKTFYYGLGYNELTSSYLSDFWQYAPKAISSIAERSDKKEFLLYPTINTGAFFINTDLRSYLIKIFDMDGRLVYEKTADENYIQTSLEPGTYLYTLSGIKSEDLPKMGRFIVTK